MVDNQFFDEPREQSQIKARIVEKYLWAWANVVIPTAREMGNRILYIDLFAGPGRYDDGTLSTPLLVLRKAIDDPNMRNMLVTFFNDRDSDSAGKLRAAIDALEGVEKLKYKPRVSNEIVGEEIEKKLAAIRLVPTFFFVDPWGYKGLSLGLIKSVLQNWGSDCVFFFNYNRVNMGLNNPAVKEHMDALFGSQRAEKLRDGLVGLNPDDRENLIVEELCAALREMGASYVLPFTFKNEEGRRTSHHLIFATKHFKGYEIMKGIMAKESSEHHQGVASFEYSPASEEFPILHGLSRPLDALHGILLKDFAGETATMKEIYERHCVGTPYISSNYKRALAELEAKKKIRVEPPAAERPKKKGEVTFADHARVTFPRKNDMSLHSDIEWTDATWNPVRGCTKISPGCKHCYAETFAERFRGVKGHPYEQGFDLRLVPEKLTEPFLWRSPKLVFVNSMSDLFQDGVPEDYIEAVCKIMVKANWHTFQVLTKRSARLKELLSGRLRFAAEQGHIWWGVSVEDQGYGLPRIGDLQESPAKVRFLSIEPLLEDLGTFDLSGISWAIVGGESGPGAREMKRAWVVSVRDQCQESRVPFFFKQWGGVRKAKRGRLLDNQTYDEYPERVPAPVPEKANCVAYAREILNSLRQIVPANPLAQASV